MSSVTTVIEETAAELHEKGYRAWYDSGESCDRFTLTTPDPEDITLKFEDRFDEVSGVDNKVLGFKQVEGPEGVLPFEPTSKLLKELAKMTKDDHYCSIANFLQEITALGRNGKIVVEYFQDWLSRSYGPVEIDIINHSQATYETVIIMKAETEICCKERRFVESARNTILCDISAIADKHNLKPIK